MSADPSQFYTVTYPSEAVYQIAKRTDAIVWTYPIVLAVCIWDWLVSLSKERERIWKRPFSIISVLYICSRYYSIFCICYLTAMYVPEIHSWQFCERAFRWACGLTIPIEMFSGAILLIRSWAFGGRKLWQLIVFIVLYITMITYMIIVTVKGLALVPWMIIGQTTGRCITAGSSENQIPTGFWVAPLGFCIILTGTTLVESLRLRRRMPEASRSPLFKVFIRDGLMYLVVVTITNSANVAFFAQKDSSLKGSAMAFQFLFSSLMSCRLVLSLRDSEAMVFRSAAASIATKSFWKTGNASVPEFSTARQTPGFGSDEDGVESIAMGGANGGRAPTYRLNQPLEVHVRTDRAEHQSEKESFTELPMTRY